MARQSQLDTGVKPGGSEASGNQPVEAGMLVDLLKQLRDVPGVFGTFVVSSEGTTLGKDLPAVFDDTILGEVGPRIVRLADVMALSGEPVQEYVLDYGEYRLYVRPGHSGEWVCVITEAAVNQAALKLAVNLVVRRLSGQTKSSAPERAAPVTPSDVAPKTLSSSAIAAAVRMYRGRRID